MFALKAWLLIACVSASAWMSQASTSLGKQPIEQCPSPHCDCRNLGDGVVDIYCERLNITTWPATFLPRTRSLFFGENHLMSMKIPGSERYPSIQNISVAYNRITVLEHADLITLPNLRYLDIRFNGLTTISDTTFRYTPLLTTLLLSNNAIAKVTRTTFFGLGQLLRLDLSMQVGALEIEQHSFAGPTRLQNLSLAGCGLAEIPTTDFRTNLGQLKVLELENNSISVIPNNVFFSLNSLESLDFSRNLLVNFTQQSLFGLSSLQTMNLAYNPLHEVAFDNYRYTPRLRNLDIRFSKIQDIVPFGFVPSSPLGFTLTLDSFLLRGNLLTVVRNNAFYAISTNILDLSYNLIERVEYNYFGYVPHIDFSNNRLAELSTTVFGDNDVLTINASRNFLTYIPYDAFSGVNIRYVDLSFNNISQVSRGAFRAPGRKPGSNDDLEYVGRMNTLNISFQSGSWELENGTFRLLENLKTLDLRSAGISNYSGDAFMGLGSLEYLDVAENAAVNLPDLTGLTDLLTLRFNLLGNHRTLAANYFWPTPNITHLYIANGSLQQMENNIFRNLTYLNTLDLSSNLLGSFSSDLFGDASIPLEYLNLNSNPTLTTIPESVLKLYPSITTLLMKSCSVATVPPGLFNASVNLHTLDLSHNHITVLDAYAFQGTGDLTNLYLNHNRISSIHAQTFLGLHHLRKLHLNGNQLLTLPQFSLSTVAAFDELKLDGNRISTLPQDFGNISAQALHLYNNPWECTCGIFWLHNLIRTEALPLEDMIRCSLPTNYTSAKVGLVAEAFVFCVPPSIVSITPSQAVLEGTSFHLTCEVFGYPAPEVRWYKDSDRLALAAFNVSATSTQQRRTQASNGSLLFSDVVGSDEGLYTCIATSSVRTTSANVFLTVVDDCRNGSCFTADVVLRYFRSPHPDFSKPLGSTMAGIVTDRLLPSSGSPTLDTSRVPSAIGPGGDVSSHESFSQWFKTDTGVNEEGSVQLRFDKTTVGTRDVYTFADNTFYPADRYNGSGSVCTGFFRTTQFTGALRTVLPVSRLHSITLHSSHSSWLYIDQQLVVDMGGVHAAQRSTVDLSSTSARGVASVLSTGDIVPTEVPLILKHNSSVRLELFLANRHDCSSSLTISITYEYPDSQPLRSPPFVSTTQAARFLERSPVNTSLLNIAVPALDFNLRSATDVTFSLLSVDSTEYRIRQFDLNSTSGVLKLLSSLDYETAESYIVMVRLTGTLPNGTAVTSTVAIIISVRNELDSAMYFSSPSYVVDGIDGSRHRQDGVHLLQLTLIDNDEGRDDAVVEYRVKPPSSSNYSRSGLSTAVTLVVQAVDNGTPARRADTLVTVRGIGVCQDGVYSVLASSGARRLSALSVVFQSYFITEAGGCETCTAGFFCPGDGLRYLCGCASKGISIGPVARFRSAVDMATCIPSTTHSFGKASECSPCPNGWICKGGIATPCGLHSGGLQDVVTYSSPCNDTYCFPACLPCPEGHACFNGIPAACGPGKFSKQYVSCEVCPPNSFSSNASNDVCKCCEVGFESTAGKDGCRQCEPSEYSAGTLATGECDVCHSCNETDLCPCLTLQPCSAGVQCVNTPDAAPFYKCLQCPNGQTGDGVTCSDLDECTVGPCSELTRCVNTDLGYYCTACPAGYGGVTSHGIGMDHAAGHKQNCSDVNECGTNNGGCDPLSYCKNTQGGFECGPCVPGYLGNGYSGCTSGDYCALNLHDCHGNATCTMTGVARYLCECKFGFAGPGRHCGVDDDLDGYPATALNCQDASCVQDNCPSVPNSDQSDTDGDRQGDACDADDDEDSWIDSLDNCQYIPNIIQRDGDGDNIGDACDNCPEVANPRQWDTDMNGLGDACSRDSDSDGFPDTEDNCPRVANTGNATKTPGPECSLCPPFQGSTIFTPHPSLLDDDFDDIGNDCSVNLVDSDLDGIPDSFDNCPAVANAEQADHDGGGAGDACEGDDDEDGVRDELDNCQYVSNPRQTDTLGNGIGDACRTDYDGDGVPNSEDACPFIKSINRSNFSTLLNLSIPVPSMADAQWHVGNPGSTVTLTSQSPAPIILLAPPRVGAVDFAGTVFVDNAQENDFLGFVFSFQSTKRFYLAQWKRTAELYLNQPSTMSKAYWSVLKSPLSEVGAWTGNNSIYDDITGDGWLPRVAYSWVVHHRPERGHIRIVVRNVSHLILDTGSISDGMYRGGRLGLFSFWQADLIWSNLTFSCAQKFDFSLFFDGIDDYVHLPNATSLGLSESFTVEVWIEPRKSDRTQPLPVLCSPDGHIAVFVSTSGYLTAMVGSAMVQSPVYLFNRWSHCAVSFNTDGNVLMLSVNFGSPLIASGGHSHEGVARMYLGRDTSANVFHGEMEEVRFWSSVKSAVDLQPYRVKGSLEGLPGLADLTAQYTFDGEHSAIVQDSSDRLQHALIYGNAPRRASRFDPSSVSTSPEGVVRKRRQAGGDDATTLPAEAMHSLSQQADRHGEFQQLGEELDDHSEL